MKNRFDCRKRLASFLVILLLFSIVSPVVYAQTADNIEENEKLDDTNKENNTSGDMNEKSDGSIHYNNSSLSIKNIENDESEQNHAIEQPLFLSTKNTLTLKNNLGLSAEDPIIVPEEGMVIKNKTYYGIEKDWFKTINPNKQTIYLSIQIPNTVTTIANDGFRDSYTSDKKNYNAVTSYDAIGRYSIVSIDFSTATSLTNINNQAAMGCALSGVLDLSNTKIKTIGKSAFSGCNQLTGIILPNTLEVLGDVSGNSGSVFNGCTSLQFVKTASSAANVKFELPQSLKVIGKQTFRNSFPKGSNLIIKLPTSVEIVGSEAFYSNSAFSQIYIERKSDLSGYSSTGFKANSSSDCLLIFPNADAYQATSSFTRVSKTYPVTLQFTNADNTTIIQKKLYGQSIKYTLNSDNIWYLDDQYTLPEIDPINTVPGYDLGWQINGSTFVLSTSSKVTGWIDDILTIETVNDSIVSKPTVDFTVNGNVVKDPVEGVQTLNVDVDENNPGSIGVRVTHPLATKEAKEKGTYVYFKYCWWDESNNGVNGPRSEEQPDIFSTSTTSSKLNRVYTDLSAIEIRDPSDARTNGNYYLVEIYGYYVEKNGTPKQFYKSNHNFIGVGQDGNAGKGYVMEVNVVDKTPITITPADITIYTGGEGHDGIVDENGEFVKDSSTNGFPEPEFYLTLPDYINTLLGDEASSTNLSNQITFYYDDGQGTKREWKIEPYGTTAHSTNKNAQEGGSKFLYRILPSSDEKIPVRIEVTDPITGNTVIEDKFDPSSTENHKVYDISIYSDGINQNFVKAVITIGSDHYTLPIQFDTGKLTVRKLNQEVTTNIVSHEQQIDKDTVNAVLPDDTTYFINDSNVEVKNTNGLHLLVDNIQNSHIFTQYIQNNIILDDMKDIHFGYEHFYLDLIDTENGNVYVTLENNMTTTLYWPLPSDYSPNGHLQILHFSSLDRNHSESIENMLGKYPPESLDYVIKEINGKQYIQFEASSFSPFVLLYEKNPDKYNLTVENGSGDGQYEEGEKISIVADKAPTGKIFDKWITSDSTYLEDVYNAHTTFTMPNHDATITASYKPKTTDTQEPTDPNNPQTPPEEIEQPQQNNQIEALEKAESDVDTNSLDATNLWISGFLISLLLCSTIYTIKRQKK